MLSPATDSIIPVSCTFTLNTINNQRNPAVSEWRETHSNLLWRSVESGSYTRFWFCIFYENCFLASRYLHRANL